MNGCSQCCFWRIYCWLLLLSWSLPGTLVHLFSGYATEKSFWSTTHQLVITLLQCFIRHSQCDAWSPQFSSANGWCHPVQTWWRMQTTHADNGQRRNVAATWLCESSVRTVWSVFSQAVLIRNVRHLYRRLARHNISVNRALMSLIPSRVPDYIVIFVFIQSLHHIHIPKNTEHNSGFFSILLILHWLSFSPLYCNLQHKSCVAKQHIIF